MKTCSRRREHRIFTNKKDITSIMSNWSFLRSPCRMLAQSEFPASDSGTRSLTQKKHSKN
jgi:hypothetical protein